jgi:hypothetical protein
MRNYWALSGESNNTKTDSRVTNHPKIMLTYTLSVNMETSRGELTQRENIVLFPASESVT